jgi:tRNA(adenine34) deaminase
MQDVTDADLRLMALALDQAEAAVAKGQTPFGAVVTDRDGALVGQGHNQVRSDRDPTAHGEVVAIRDAWRGVGSWTGLAGGTVYTSCEPCLLCTYVITQIGFARVVFAARGTDVPGHGPLLGADLARAAEWVNAQPGWTPLEVVGDVLRERALALIAAFPWGEAEARTEMAPPGRAPGEDDDDTPAPSSGLGALWQLLVALFAVAALLVVVFGAAALLARLFR